MDSFDIDDFEDVLSLDVRLNHPTTGEPTPMLFTLAGPQHPLRKEIMFKRQRRLIEDTFKSGKPTAGMGTVQEAETEELEYLVLCTLGWQGVKRRGVELPFSPAAARELYSEPQRHWIRKQVKAALEDAEAFIQRSAAT